MILNRQSLAAEMFIIMRRKEKRYDMVVNFKFNVKNIN